MADSTPPPEAIPTADSNPVSRQPQSDTLPSQPDPSSTAVPPLSSPNPSTPPPHSVSTLPPPSVSTLPPPPSILTLPPPPIHPSFRPAGTPVPVPSAAATQQFPTVTYQTPGVPPPGVVIPSSPAVGSGPPGQAPMPLMHPMMLQHYAMAGQPIRYASPMPNGYQAIPQPLHQGSMPPGVLRYPSPYAPMIRPAFPARPLIGVMPPLARPPLVGIRGPIMPPVVMAPAIPGVLSAEKPQTTVYVGKISSTVENDFMLPLLQLCGPVKNWKRPQDPTGTLKGFGFCEFEDAEGVLRALRLLNKLSVDGQELMLNVNQATREYLERYVEKKSESLKSIKESETEGSEKETVSASGAETDDIFKSSEESLKPSSDDQKKDENEMNKENPDAASFGLVTDEDRKADREALEKLAGMIEDRLKSKPLPPPPPPPQRVVDGPGNSNSEQPSESRDRESEEDLAKNDSEEKNEDEKTAESKPSTQHDRTETVSPDRSRRHDRTRDRDTNREKEKELEKYEREREQERAKREKDREHRSREDERRYKVREKEWETREKEREHWQKREREREKERAQERKWEIMDQERDGDDGYGKKRRYKTSDEDRRRRQREKEDDQADRLREEEEIAEAKIRAKEEQKKQLEVLKIITDQPANGHEKAVLLNETSTLNQVDTDQIFDRGPSHGTYEGEGVSQNGIGDEFVVPSNSASDAQLNSNLPSRKLGFGLSGSGKRTAVPSVFKEDEDEDAHKEKKMRPLVPIDYTEEQQVFQSSTSEDPSANMVAAAEFVKRISTVNPKEEKPDIEKEKSRRSHERSSQRDRNRHEDDSNRTREESRKDNFDRERSNRKKTPEKPKLLDAKQLIDTIPKSKDELFSYEINWGIYDQNALHERMRPWVSKKITDFLGEEEVTLVDYIVNSTQEHVDADEMLERLQTILDDEAEMFVLKMWRMLIFEIKKVEYGLPASK